MRSSQKGEILLPLLKRYLLEEEDRLLSGKITRDQQDIEDAKLSIECFLERAAAKQIDHPKGEYFHPSSLGQCIRKLFFQEKQAPQNDAGKKTADDLMRWHMILETGTYVHIMVQNLCARAGILKSREIPIIDKKEKIIGTADGLLDIGGEVLLEIKTINPRDFSALSQADLGHRRQAHAYMKCLKVKKAVILYFDKGGRSLFKEFVVPFDSAFYQNEVRDRIDWHYDNVRSNTLPIREGINPRLMPCLYCQFTHVCFGDWELQRFLTKLKNDTKKVDDNKGQKIKFRFKVKTKIIPNNSRFIEK